MTIFKEVPIGSAFEVRNGATPASGEERFWNGDIAWVTPADLGALNSRTISSGRRSITEEGYRSCAAELVPPGSLILSIRAPVGHLAIAETSMTFNQGCKGLVPRRIIDSAFAYWALTAYRKNLEAAAQGTTFAELSTARLRAERIPVPDLPTQQAIAAFLDRETARIDQLIAKKERLVDTIVERDASLIAQAVTVSLYPERPLTLLDDDWIPSLPQAWTIRRLRDISVSLQTGPFGSQLHSEDYVEGGVPVVNPSHMANGRIMPDPTMAVDRETLDRLARHKLERGDIVFARRGQLGRCALVGAAEVGWLCGTGSIRMRPNMSVVLPEYLIRALSTSGVSQWLRLESVGSTMDNLNTSILGRLPLPVPPIEEQREITAFVEAELTRSRKLVDLEKRSTARLRELRSALITAAVTGQVDIATWGKRGETDRRLDAIERELATDHAGVTG